MNSIGRPSESTRRCGAGVIGGCEPHNEAVGIQTSRAGPL